MWAAFWRPMRLDAQLLFAFGVVAVVQGIGHLSCALGIGWPWIPEMPVSVQWLLGLSCVVSGSVTIVAARRSKRSEKIEELRAARAPIDAIFARAAVIRREVER